MFLWKVLKGKDADVFVDSLYKQALTWCEDNNLSFQCWADFTLAENHDNEKYELCSNAQSFAKIR